MATQHEPPYRMTIATHRYTPVSRHVVEGARWHAAMILLSVASLAAAAVSLTRHLSGDAPRSPRDAGRAAAARAPIVEEQPPSLVSVTPLNGALLIVFPRQSARSTIRLQRHAERIAMFGAARIDETPLVVLPGELRVQALPVAGAHYELRVPDGVTQVQVRIGGQTMARWSGSPRDWAYGARIPIRMPAPG